MRRFIIIFSFLILIVATLSCQPVPTQEDLNILPQVAKTDTPTITNTAPAATATPHLPFSAVVEANEVVYRYEDAQNGAGPLWSFGSSLVASHNEQVFISGLSREDGLAPPNNEVCVIYERTTEGWQERFRLPGLTREPCPIAIDQESLWVSHNPAVGDLSEPQLFRYDLLDLDAEPEIFFPNWEDGHEFTPWSYRGLGVDPVNHAVMVMNISGYQAQHWAYLDSAGQWRARGQLTFPVMPAMGVTATQPVNAEPITLRLTYPSLVLRDQRAYVLAVSDIEATDEIMRTYLTNRGESTYVLQSLYYAWTDNILSQPFSSWIELTDLGPAGMVRNQDAWIAPDGTVHFLWIETTIDQRLTIFFSEVQRQVSLWHATIREGVLVSKEKIHEMRVLGAEPVRARFYENPQGRLFIFYSTYIPAAGNFNWLVELYEDGKRSATTQVHLDPGMEYFLSAGPRNGVLPSPYLHLIGTINWDDPDVRYVRIRIE